jgi:O-antigen/teichoic acid export membrane protein
MSLARVGKQFLVTNTNQLITIVTQLLTVPIFLHAYGVSLYGQWLVMAAAIAHLSTLNYGIQTYLVNEIAILYNRGEVQDCRILLSSGMRVVLALTVLIALGMLLVFLIPISRLLHQTLPPFQAQLTMYFLGLQFPLTAVDAAIAAPYMAIGRAPRGGHFGNLLNIVALVALLTLATLHMPFPVLAASRCVVQIIFAVIIYRDVKRLAPDIIPTIRYWRKGILGSILRPSFQYMLLMGSNILVYQLPLLLMQIILGPFSVVLFSVTRTVYSMTRRLLTLVTNTIGPEITVTIGERNIPKLRRLYELSERIVLLLTVPITFGSMIATPFLLQVWLHKGSLFDPIVCILLGLTVSVQGLKEHKYQFQFSSNQVRETSYAGILVYGVMLVLAIPALKLFQLPGYLVLWSVAESVLLFYVLHLNRRLFHGEFEVDQKPAYQMYAVLIAGIALFYVPMMHIAHTSYAFQVATAVVITLVTGAISYWIFKVDDLRSYLWSKLKGKIPLMARLG